MRVFRLTVIVGILTLFVQCASVPLTGRKQVMLLPESEMMQMSLTSYGDFLKENKLSTRTDDTRRVKEVGTRIAAAVEAYLKSQGLEKQIRRTSFSLAVRITSSTSTFRSSPFLITIISFSLRAP